ncbi:MAG: hypothetical protein RL594_1042 [Bacteroidota bacterium]
MSQLFNAEAQPEFESQSVTSPVRSTDSVPVSAEVELAMRKFWDVVRSSAETIVTLRQEVAQLQAQAAIVTHQRLEEDIARIAELQGALLDAQQMNQLLEADVANALRRVSELEAALEDGRVAQLQMHADVAETIQTLEGDIAAAAQQRAQLEQDLAGMRLRVAELEARLDEKNDQLDGATEMAVRFEIIEREKSELEQQNERLQQRSSDLERVIDEKNARNETLVAELSQARREVVEFELQLSGKDSEIQELVRQTGELRNRITVLEQEVELASMRPAPAPVSPDLDAAEFEALQQRLRELEANEGLHEQADAELQRLADEVMDLQQQLQRAMGIVEIYRAAGLRHLEDPSQRNQMTLFGAMAAMDVPELPVHHAAHEHDSAKLEQGYVMLSEDELNGMADRLDNLADRVAELLRIS